jgi:hypothetical protein
MNEQAKSANEAASIQPPGVCWPLAFALCGNLVLDVARGCFHSRSMRLNKSTCDQYLKALQPQQFVTRGYVSVTVAVTEF